MLSENWTGVMPVIEVRRGMPGVMLGGMWTPLAIRGGDGSEGEGENPPANGSGSNNPPNPKPDEKDDESKYSEQARLTIQKLRGELKEAKSGGKEVETLKAKLKEIEDAQLSESEKLKKDNEELKASVTAAEQKSRDRVIRSEVRVIASELGFADPSDAIAFIDTSAIEFDEDGEPKGIKALLEKLAKDKAYLLKTTTGTTGVPGTPRPNGQAQTRDEKIDHAYEKLKAARL